MIYVGASIMFSCFAMMVVAGCMYQKSREDDS